MTSGLEAAKPRREITPMWRRGGWALPLATPTAPQGCHVIGCLSCSPDARRERSSAGVAVASRAGQRDREQFGTAHGTATAATPPPPPPPTAGRR